MYRRPVILMAVLASACSPTLDWREVRPVGSGAQALFPCRPGHESRTVGLAGLRIAMTLHACKAGGTTWALGFADVGDPARVGTALSEMADAAARNLAAAAPPAGQPLAVPGMTPTPQARRLVLSGKLPDGTAVRMHVAVFSKGTRVFQASAVGAGPAADAVDSFFFGLRVDS